MSEESRPLEPIFILGIMPRSGTNFLYELLRLHPAVDAVHVIKEDYLLAHADLLLRYAKATYTEWNPRWRAADIAGPPEKLLGALGQGLTSFLHATSPDSLPPAQVDSGRQTPPLPSRLVTKTPSVENLHLFHALFPEAPLLIVVRDGRSVVESGILSFRWRFEFAARRWVEAARTLLRFQAESAAAGRSLIVPYEALHCETETTLRRIFAFLGLDAEAYDFTAAQELPVRGSSVFGRSGPAVHWQPVAKTAAFQPLGRWRHWPPRRQRRFNWIAGRELEKLGYRKLAGLGEGLWWRVANLGLDTLWRPLWGLWRVRRWFRRERARRGLV